jgi:hypothetical protein
MGSHKRFLMLARITLWTFVPHFVHVHHADFIIEFFEEISVSFPVPLEFQPVIRF